MLRTCHLLTSLIIWYFLNNVIIFFIAQLLVNLLIIEYNVHTKRTIDRKADAVTPIPPNVETRRTPSEEQLAHVLESALRDDLVGTYWKGTLTPKAESSVVWRGAF